MELKKDTKYLAVSAVPLRGFRRAGFSFSSKLPMLFALRKVKRDDDEKLDLSDNNVALLGLDPKDVDGDAVKLKSMLADSMLHVVQLKQPPGDVKELRSLAKSMQRVTHARVRDTASASLRGDTADGTERGKELRKNKHKNKKPSDVKVKGSGKK